MKSPPRRDDAADLDGAARRRESTRDSGQPTQDSTPLESWRVIAIRDDGRRVEWCRAHHELAERIAARLRRHGLTAVVERVEAAG